MTGLILAIAYGVATGLPALYFLYRNCGRNGYQIQNDLPLSFKQKCENVLFVTVVVVGTGCGCWIVNATFVSSGYGSLLAGLLVSAVTGAMTLILGCFLVPDTELYYSESWHTRVREKHDVIRQYGFTGAVARMRNHHGK